MYLERRSGTFEFVILKCNQRYTVIIISSLFRQDRRTCFHHIGNSRYQSNNDRNPEHNDDSLFDGYKVLEMSKEQQDQADGK